LQQLQVSLSIPVPENMVLIQKIELEELKANELKGVYWSMKGWEQKTGKKSEWIKENILYPSRFRRVLDTENGGFVYYPKCKGQTWGFQATKMAAFLEKHVADIFNK